MLQIAPQIANNEKLCFFSRYLRSELSKQEQSSSEVVRSLLGKSPKKEEKQIEVTSPKKEEGQVLESVECNSSKLEEEQFVNTRQKQTGSNYH